MDDLVIEMFLLKLLVALIVSGLCGIGLCTVILMAMSRCPNCKSFKVRFKRRDGKRWCGHEDHPMKEHIDLSCDHCGHEHFRTKDGKDEYGN
jgi:Zn finger protein HypA/HybF involved in hydrogenase expression